VKTLVDQLSSYASYHRDRRNIATHLVGIPLIVQSLVILLSRPAIALGGVSASPAWVVTVVALLYYLRLDRTFGWIMAVVLALGVCVGAWAATLSTPQWLALGAGGFVLGWVIQFIGHVFEGRKPAFFDDIMGLLIGPLFVVAEVFFAMGGFADLKHEVERRAGPVRS